MLNPFYFIRIDLFVYSIGFIYNLLSSHSFFHLYMCWNVIYTTAIICQFGISKAVWIYFNMLRYLGSLSMPLLFQALPTLEGLVVGTPCLCLSWLNVFLWFIIMFYDFCVCGSTVNILKFPSGINKIIYLSFIYQFWDINLPMQLFITGIMSHASMY